MFFVSFLDDKIHKMSVKKNLYKYLTTNDYFYAFSIKHTVVFLFEVNFIFS